MKSCFHEVPQHFSIATGDTVTSWNVPMESEASVPVESEASGEFAEASGEFVESRAKD